MQTRISSLDYGTGGYWPVLTKNPECSSRDLIPKHCTGWWSSLEMRTSLVTFSLCSLTRSSLMLLVAPRHGSTITLLNLWGSTRFVCVAGARHQRTLRRGIRRRMYESRFFFFVFRLPVLGDLLRFGFQKSHDGAADDDDDYWGSYGDAAEEVVTSQLPINYVQKLATSLSEQQSPLPQQYSSFAPSPLRTVASSVVEEGTGERSRSQSPEKRKLGQSDMMLDDYSGEDGHSNGGSPGAGVLGGDYGRTKRPILPSSLSTTTPQMSERDIMKALLKTNIQSLYGMARLSGITKAEFEEIVQKCCQ